jgi:CheY-like chemotaxis protein
MAEHESARVRVLLVDDDPAALATLAGVLEVDFDVVACESPLRALELVRSDPPDVVCADLRMPEMDGRELLRQVADLPDAPRSILITGYAEMLRGEASHDARILGVVLKPFDPPAMIRLVAQVGRIAQLERSVRRLAGEAGARRA